MAGRPVDHQRRAELLDAVVDYAVEHGFSGLSWRPLAAALGVSPTTLVHHFGTKEQMLVAILGRLRERIVAASSDRLGEQPDLATAARAAWTQTSDPRRRPEFRLFFAVYGRALQAPQQFAEFLDRVVADWMGALVDAQGPDTDPATATRAATLVIATIRGLLLDLLATGDRDRIEDAAEAFLAALEHKARPPGRTAAPSCRPRNGDTSGGLSTSGRVARARSQQVEGRGRRSAEVVWHAPQARLDQPRALARRDDRPHSRVGDVRRLAWPTRAPPSRAGHLPSKTYSCHIVNKFDRVDSLYQLRVSL